MMVASVVRFGLQHRTCVRAWAFWGVTACRPREGVGMEGRPPHICALATL